MLTEQERTEGWIALFDGETLEGWAATGKEEGWVVDSETILCTVKGGGYLYTKEQFDDFILSVDFMTEPKVNSGIFFRWSDLQDPVHTGFEVQILDTHGKQPTGTHDCGALYDMVAPSTQACKPAGEWNTCVITCKDNAIAIALNDETVVEADLNDYTTPGMNLDGTKNKFKYAWKYMPRRGHIGLQDHGGKSWFRNLKLKPLK